MGAEKYKERLDKANGEIEFLKAAREKAEDDIARFRNELEKVSEARNKHVMEQERHNNEMHVLKNEIQKWQDKNEMTVKDLQMRESALHRIEVELDCARTDLERAKLQCEKSESSSQLQEKHMAQLQRDVDNWKDK